MKIGNMRDKDQLEEFIKANREAFDDKVAPDGLWNKISKDLDATVEPKTKVLWYWKVAVVVLLAAVTFLVADNYVLKPTTETTLANEVAEFEELESFYTSIIRKKEVKLSSALAEEKALDYLANDIEELEILYSDLRKAYVEGQQTPEVYDRLIHLLRRRIHLINAQLDIIAQEKFPDEMEVKIN